jgi:hypothetical protein
VDIRKTNVKPSWGAGAVEGGGEPHERQRVIISLKIDINLFYYLNNKK